MPSVGAMTVIKDGSVAGSIPSMEVFALHYPGYFSSLSVAIETLGGTESFLKLDFQARLQSHKVELCFRPKDPYSHPTLGKLRACNNLLLKISKKKFTDGRSAKHSDCTLKHQLQEASNSDMLVSLPESEEVASAKEVAAQIMEEEDQTEFCADIVAQVSEAYSFDGMVDYQHVLAVHMDAARKKKRHWTEMEEPHFGKGGLMDMDHEDVMILVPPIFSPKDMPEELALKPPPILSSNKKHEGVAQQNEEIYIERGFAIDFKVQEIPKQVNWENHISPDEWDIQTAVCKLFDERPIWPRVSLAERLLDQGLKIECVVLKRILLINAYYFLNGPFNRFFIKRGYDPRTDPDSCKYQRIDFRVPQSLQSYPDTNTMTRWEDVCAFRIFPYRFQVSFLAFKGQIALQLFELADDYIQQEIRKPPKQETCSYVSGWFSKSMYNSFKQRVKVKFLSAYPKTGPHSLLKAAISRQKVASERFEKLKRMSVYNDAMKQVDEHQQDNREPKGNAIEEEPKNVDGGDVIDEIDDEDDEEEMDAYEPLGLDAENSLRSNSYLDVHNISRTYLQELFGTFPSTEEADGDDKVQEDAESSDGEYQIYEQDIDDDDEDD